MRCAATDSAGVALNEYPHGNDATIEGTAPQLPWAVYLASSNQYWLLGFDFDAKTAASRAGAARDAATLQQHLSTIGLNGLVCESGPGGGRHLWLALTEPVPATEVAQLARLVQHTCPSLDLAPLTNPATGCLRPPGAPHRSGGASRVLSGSLDQLTSPTATLAQVRALADLLASVVTEGTPHIAAPLPHHALPIDSEGRPFLPGARRPLPGRTLDAIATDVMTSDASQVMWRIAIGAAASRWRFDDFALLLPQPGMEHARTERVDSGRRPRPPHATRARLLHVWKRACAHVAARPSGADGDDPTFDARAGLLANHVRQLQQRAAAAAGRFSHRGGPADRRVLDVLSLLALQAVRADVEADIRRVGLLAGVSRETARVALCRLEADGWIARTAVSDGRRASQWTIDPRNVIPRVEGTGLSQAVSPRGPSPAPHGAATRLLLIHDLTARTGAARHDLFTHAAPALGFTAGNLYAHLTPTAGTTSREIATITGLSQTHVDNLLGRMGSLGIIQFTSHGWVHSPTDRRDAVAEHLGVAGRLSHRAATYRAERIQWGWWDTEAQWMSAPGRHRRRPDVAQLALPLGRPWDQYPKYPRDRRGRANHRAAARMVREGIVTNCSVADHALAA